MAEVTKQLDGLGVGEQPESYSGFLTVDKNYDSNMFFWFVPATVSTRKKILMDRSYTTYK